MSDYIATLEAQNEELKKLLADAQSMKPKWVRANAPEDYVMWQYKLGESLIGYYEYNETISPNIYVITKITKMTVHDEKKAKFIIENEFNEWFLRCVE